MRMSWRYVLKRIGYALITLYVAITVDFILPRIMGGNPADTLASQSALGNPAVTEALKKEFGLSNPSLLYQYKQYLIQLLHGNMGVSYSSYPATVVSTLFKALPWTIGIVFTATIISFVIGWIIAIHAAWRTGGKFDSFSVAISFTLHSVPYFWIGILLVILLAFYLRWFPMGQAFSTSYPNSPTINKWGDILHHAILPVLSLVLVSTAGHLLPLRNNLLRVLSEDYMTLAKAKGLSVRRRKYLYGARNALLPSFTSLMMSLGHVIGGALATEIVFSYPGVGMLIYNAILNHDYPVIQGAFLLIAVSVIGANLVSDFIYPLIDPRVALD